MAVAAWRRLGVGVEAINLENTLLNGQCFSWTRTGDVFTSVLDGHVVNLAHRPPGKARQPLGLYYRSDGDVEGALVDYFQLGTAMGPMVEAWGAADGRLATIADSLPGMRVLRQPPFECLISFIASSNNNIARITKMLASVREKYGDAAGVSYDGADTVYTFPSPETLASEATEKDLRSLGWGYRAPFIVRTAQAVVEKGGEDWLLSLRTKPRKEVQEELMAFHGVGMKVADCVALFCCDQHGVVPVDTHVWHIACRYFDATLKDCKSLTPSVYDRVGQLFRDRYGPHAGWAHCLLFTAELPAFRGRLPEAVQTEMGQHAAEEKAWKAAMKEAKAAGKAKPGKAGAGAGRRSTGGSHAKAASKKSATGAAKPKKAKAVASKKHKPAVEAARRSKRVKT